MLVLAVYSQQENISFFSLLNVATSPSPSCVISTVSTKVLICFLPVGNCSIFMLDTQAEWKKKKNPNHHKALDLQIISHSRSGSANFPHQKKKKARSKRQRETDLISANVQPVCSARWPIESQEEGVTVTEKPEPFLLYHTLAKNNNSTAANRTLKALCTSMPSFPVITVISPGTRGGMNHYLDVIT